MRSPPPLSSPASPTRHQKPRPIAAPQQVRAVEDLSRAEKAHLSYESAMTSGARVENGLGWITDGEAAQVSQHTAGIQCAVCVCVCVCRRDIK